MRDEYRKVCLEGIKDSRCRRQFQAFGRSWIHPILPAMLVPSIPEQNRPEPMLYRIPTETKIQKVKRSIVSDDPNARHSTTRQPIWYSGDNEETRRHTMCLHFLRGGGCVSWRCHFSRAIFSGISPQILSIFLISYRHWKLQAKDPMRKSCK